MQILYIYIDHVINVSSSISWNCMIIHIVITKKRIHSKKVQGSQVKLLLFKTAKFSMASKAAIFIRMFIPAIKHLNNYKTNISHCCFWQPEIIIQQLICLPVLCSWQIQGFQQLLRTRPISLLIDWGSKWIKRDSINNYPIPKLIQLHQNLPTTPMGLMTINQGILHQSKLIRLLELYIPGIVNNLSISDLLAWPIYA